METGQGMRTISLGKPSGKCLFLFFGLILLAIHFSACSFSHNRLVSGDPLYDKYLKITRDQAAKDPLVGIWQGSDVGREIVLAIFPNEVEEEEKLKAVLLNGSDYEFGYLQEDSWFYVSPLAAPGTYGGRVSVKFLAWHRWFPTRVVLQNTNQFTSYDDIPSGVKQGGSTTHQYLRREAQTGAIDDLMRSSGSGFLLWESDKVLTAYHVIKSAKKVSVRFPDGTLYQAAVTASDPANDLAILSLQGFKAPQGKGFHVLQGVPVAPGEDVHVIGYPLGSILGNHPGIVSGQVSASVGIRNAENQFRITASINPGNSGGPIINARGEVIGVAISVIRQQQIEGVAFGVKIGSSLPLPEGAIRSATVMVRTPLRADEVFRGYSEDVVLVKVE